MPAYPPTYKTNVRDAVRGNLRLYDVTDLEPATIQCLVAAALDLSERHAAQYNQVTAPRRRGRRHRPHLGRPPDPLLKAYKRWVRQFWG